MNTDYDDLLLHLAGNHNISKVQVDRLIKDWLLTEEAAELLEKDIEKQLEG